MTLRETVKLAAKLLKNAKIENPRLEAEILAAHFLKKDRLYLITHDDEAIPDTDVKAFKRLADKRAGGEPMAYILGYKEFYGRNFIVNKDVLIPRPETEMLIELIKGEGNAKILDLCAGSGCIGLTLALECKDAKVTLSDISPKAVDIIKKNAENLGVEVNIVESDLFDDIEGKFDIIVSNPPYIGSETIEMLETTVKDYEPRLALDGGRDGLKFYKKIIPNSKKYLSENGRIFFEMGFDEGEQIKSLLMSNTFSDIKIYKDLANLDRVISAQKVADG